ncbi:hypothetical protein M422DRAFT_57167, partial [Sphaerobolus stellatus SS14]
PSSPDEPKIYTVSCWIPSKVGKQFIVNIDHDTTIDRGTWWRAVLTADGHAAINRQGIQVPLESPVLMSGYRDTGGRSERPFVFTAITLTDEEVFDNSINLNALGTLNISVQRVQVLNIKPVPCVPVGYLLDSIPRGLSATSRVHEATKKAGCHRVSLGEVKELRHPIKWRGNTRPMDNQPTIRFKFHYRSEDILRAQGLISSPAIQLAEPLVLLSEFNTVDDDGDLSDKALIDEIHDLEEKLVTLKKRKASRSLVKVPPKRSKIEEDDG